ncbi:complex I subunit 5 family protein [Stieleria varia]|uniref:Na(+)/H(+) antiporter subunit D n=1 Tax=Stieleria varia TaxID=2528005 RepID=A0A5C6B1G7_9BACT|nr:proton-conducting transporter membrane subunit [Stieleria varia]TWU06155.1 Na(+)/H(+) antiporter subunit D [Stieleria varia]
MMDQLPVVIFLIPFVTAICVPMIGYRNRDWCGPIALLATIAMSVAAIVNLYVVLANGESRYAFGGWSISTSLPAFPLGIEWVNDPLASVMLVTLSGLSCICILYGTTDLPRSLGSRVVLYYTLVLILISALAGIVLAGDIFNVFVFLEVVALCAYALIGVSGGKALVAAFRYLILGTLGSSFYLLGVVFFYAATGTLNMGDLAQQLIEKPELMTSKAIIGGSTFLFLGLGIKMALFPLHGWLPGAYARAPSAVTPLLASLMTKIALYAWVRIMFWVLGAGAEIGHVHLLTLLGMLGTIATVAGAIIALAQDNLKRMFAYGGISHIGLILIGVSQENGVGLAGSLFYMINDAVMQASAFIIAGAAISLHDAQNVNELSRLRRSPWLVGSLIILAMSMIGVPPTGGFFGKWQIILSALQAANYVEVAAIIVATVLTMAYFLKIFSGIFGDGHRKAEQQPNESKIGLRICLAVTSAAMVVLGLCADPMSRFFRATATSVGL